MGNKKGSKWGILILIIMALLLWGLVGAYLTRKAETSCIYGFKELLCWRW